MWQIEFNAAQVAGEQRRKYRIRVATRLDPIVWGALLLALLAIMVMGGAGLALGIGRGLGMSTIVMAFLFSVLFGATVGAAAMSHLRNGGLRQERRDLAGEIGRLLARGRGLVSDEPLARHGTEADGEEDRIVSLLAALERGDIEPHEFDAALDQELRGPEELSSTRSHREAHHIRAPFS
jgi:hypothetical protein